MALDHPFLERGRRIDERKLETFLASFSGFRNSGHRLGRMWLRFLLSCTQRPTIEKFVELLARKSSVPHQSSLDKEFWETELMAVEFEELRASVIQETEGS